MPKTNAAAFPPEPAEERALSNLFARIAKEGGITMLEFLATRTDSNMPEESYRRMRDYAHVGAKGVGAYVRNKQATNNARAIALAYMKFAASTEASEAAA